MLIDIARIAELEPHPRSRRQDRGRRGGDAEQAAGLARPEGEAAAAGGRPAPRRPFPDPQQRHGVRLDRACRSELGNSAVARDARRRGRAAQQARRARAEGKGLPARHADHRARGRRADRRGAAFRCTARAWRSARWRGGTAISPWSRWRPWSTARAASGSASAAWRASRWCGASRQRRCKDAVDKLAAELEGYEDLHASAELRRDILRNLAPLVIAEAQKCAA